MKIEKNTGKIIEKTIPECLGTTANLYKLFLVFVLYTTHHPARACHRRFAESPAGFCLWWTVETLQEPHSSPSPSLCDVSIVQYCRYLKDFFTSMIDLSWSWTLLGFAASFYFSWVVFALVWFLVLYCHGKSQKGKKGNIFFLFMENSFFFPDRKHP